MRFTLLFVSAAAALAIPAEAAPRDSVVKIEVTARQPDFARPWSKRSPRKSSGSGVMIEGGRILTNAHVVRHASLVEVQPTGASNKFAAVVVAVAPDIDLALLELEEPDAAPEIPAMEIDAELPALRQGVTVLGYPVGGDELSITEGIVSRIEFSSYYYDARGLRVQIDAALNPGNSGGPAVSDGRLIGVVFSKIEEADNIGYLIPSEEVLTFLADVDDGRYDGKADIAGEYGIQRLENVALRRRLGLDGDTTGVMVREIGYTPEGGLREWDVITHVGPHAIDNQGFVRISDDLRLSFGYHVDRLATDEGVPLTVFRDGESIELVAPVERDANRVISALKHDYPEYFIWGPVVFTAAVREIVAGQNGRAMGLLAASRSPMLPRINDRREFEGEQIVIIPNRLFPHRITRGYTGVSLAVVEEVDGEPVRSLSHLVELLRDGSDEYVEIRLGGSYEMLVFRRDQAEAATEEILTDEGIRRRGSPALMEVWREGKAG